jgi:hypothetical protein
LKIFGLQDTEGVALLVTVNALVSKDESVCDTVCERDAKLDDVC